MIFLGILGLVQISKKSKYYLHMVQLEGYKPEEYKKWINNNKNKAVGYEIPKETSKKPLVFTDRAKRLFYMNLGINGLLIIGGAMAIWSLIWSFMPVIHILGLIIFLLLVYLVFLYESYLVLLSTGIMKPIEESINQGFYKSAQNKIKSREDLIVVGITGSFGKTSTKFILGTILSEKFKVLNTPESYNTPMGLSKTINNQLTKDHEVFIAELGARNIGDIEEVSNLVRPKFGLVTSIGPTHIETFKNMDNIMKTKYELIESLPTDGIAVFNYDNEYLQKLSDKTFKEKRLYGIENIEDLDIYAEDIQVSEKGSSFTLKDKEGNSIRCNTKLLGKHNIYNILAGVVVAKELGLTYDEIRSGIEKIEPIPHRLNIIDPGTGIIIIDDAFNSNPIGSKAALEVLSQFKEGRKIIVTPGMVELGTMEEDANREFGENIGKVCDYTILIGEKRTEPIFQGLMNVNYNKENIFIAKDLNEATLYIQKIARPKDIVLFENDLPDNYSE